MCEYCALSCAIPSIQETGHKQKAFLQLIIGRLPIQEP